MDKGNFRDTNDSRSHTFRILPLREIGVHTNHDKKL